MNLDVYFSSYRDKIIGNNTFFEGPYGSKKIIYADWIASGRLYSDIENKLLNEFGPYVGNTHTSESETGKLMTYSYHYAQEVIKKHVNSDKHDVIILAGFGMTAVVNKLQRMLGLKGEKNDDPNQRPVVFLTHMEHHSNHTSWFETNCDVVVLEPNKDLLVDYDELERLLSKYQNRKLKIGSFTACSNVTGIRTDIHRLAKIMHKYGGVCFADFAANAPYDQINMHPKSPDEKLDGVMFSPHKFLGGPGGSGVLIFDSRLYNSKVPDHPGGGTVDWTNPWGEYKYIDDIEVREDGGTPGFLQAIKVALAIKLKEKMQVSLIAKRERELVDYAFSCIDKIDEIILLANKQRDRLGIISFYIADLHYNLVVKIMNDKFGVQFRGGCACAGTYGHYLLEVSYKESKHITDLISMGDLTLKPGWVRWSIHPTSSKREIDYIINSLNSLIENIADFKKDYVYDVKRNTYEHKNKLNSEKSFVDKAFIL